MDKNMIKIDDLLRQRLGEAEEQERPGAWLNMRGLLDQQMPVSKVATGTNWRRMMMFAAGVVLLTALSVGGYQMSHTFMSGGGSDAEEGNSAGSKPYINTPSQGLVGSVNRSLPDAMTGENMPGTADSEPVADAGRHTDDANVLPAGNNTVSNSRTVHTNPPQAVQNAISNNNNTAPVTADNARSTNSGASNRVNNSTNSNFNNSNSSQPVTAQQSAGSEAANNNNTRQKSPAAAYIRPSKAQMLAVNKQEESVEKIPYNKIVMHERYDRNGNLEMDTIFKGEDYMELHKPKLSEQVAGKNRDDRESSGSDIVPSAAMNNTTNDASSENVKMEKLGDHRVSAKKMKNYNPGRFEEMVRNAKFRLGSVKFYPGVVIGANMSFNGNPAGHLGFAGDLSLNERWSILTEVKYAYNINGKENLKNDYIDNVEYVNINNTPYVKYDSMEHYYNFNSYSNLDVPLMLVYKTQKRFSFMGGANVRYNFRINSIQEVEQIYPQEALSVSTSVNVNETKKSVLLSDFGSSLNVGYMFGAAYQVSPGWKLDLRLTQPVWNNASTPGQKEINKRLYSSPQVQFNLTHRFSSNKPYKRK